MHTETRPTHPLNSLQTAANQLLAPYALDSADLERTFGHILAHRVDYADLYFQYSRSEGWSLEEGIVKSGSFNIDQGVGVRVGERREDRFRLLRRHQRSSSAVLLRRRPARSRARAVRAGYRSSSAPRRRRFICRTIRWRA